MPGMMDTVRNVGLCDAFHASACKPHRLTEEIAARHGSTATGAIHAGVVRRADRCTLPRRSPTARLLREASVDNVQELDFRQLGRLTQNSSPSASSTRDHRPCLPQESMEQVEAAIAAVFRSDAAPGPASIATTQRRQFPALGTAVTVQRGVTAMPAARRFRSWHSHATRPTARTACLSFLFAGARMCVSGFAMPLATPKRRLAALPDVWGGWKPCAASSIRVPRCRSSEFTVQDGRTVPATGRCSKRHAPRRHCAHRS
ncbi:MAG: hypothetical protein M5R42_06595 [Rhodocyclaceae bacterium]|nr:hypothetical protein [Rhodocyclaceae bacterium]